MPKTIVVTGASRGLGLAIVRALDREKDVDFVLGVRDVRSGEAVAKTLARPARVAELDVGTRASVKAFARTIEGPLHALVNNAGLQFFEPGAPTPDGVEPTLAVNHLGALDLTLALLPQLEGGRVMGIGSGTHNPEHEGARRAGYRGGVFTSIERLARGETTATGAYAQGRERYATSKLLVTVTAMELARRFPATTFLTFDPGLMPGTGLARTSAWYGRLLWSTVLKWIAPLMDDTSTPERSAASARELLIEPGVVSGEVYDHEGALSQRVWPEARNPDLARRVLDESLAFLGR
ncbi:MAG: SDR family NAD(P)-dependent oxidoreductase [Sandaracinus sp.]